MSQYLQTVSARAHQQRDEVNVAVFGSAHRVRGNVVGMLNGIVVDWTQNTIAVKDLIIKIVLRKSKVQGDSP